MFCICRVPLEGSRKWASSQLLPRVTGALFWELCSVPEGLKQHPPGFPAGASLQPVGTKAWVQVGPWIFFFFFFSIYCALVFQLITSCVLWWWLAESQEPIPTSAWSFLALELVAWILCCSFQVAKYELPLLSKALYFIWGHLFFSCKQQITFVWMK